MAVSTFTVQSVVDRVRTFALLEPIFNVGGYSTEPALTIAGDVFSDILAVNFPHKWNESNLPLFYTNSYQQDYALVTPAGASVTNVEWLERGIAFDINSTAVPKAWVDVECGRSLPQRTASYGGSGMGQPGFLVSSLPNYSLYYGVWGQPNVGGATLGNNPVANSVYTSPLGATSQPTNPITQITDANGNLLVLTGYGHEGTTAPVAPANSNPGVIATPGAGATTVWTVVDPGGLGIRILRVPSQTGVVWQFNIVGQKSAPAFTNMQQTLAPLPDKYESYFRAGFIAQCYRYSPEAKIRAKFEAEWKLWLTSLQGLREVQDRETEEYSFTVARTVMGGGRGAGFQQGPQWPFNNPRM